MPLPPLCASTTARPGEAVVFRAMSRFAYSKSLRKHRYPVRLSFSVPSVGYLWRIYLGKTRFRPIFCPQMARFQGFFFASLGQNNKP